MKLRSVYWPRTPLRRLRAGRDPAARQRGSVDVDRDHVVGALAPQRADHGFAVGVLPGRARGDCQAAHGRGMPRRFAGRSMLPSGAPSPQHARCAAGRGTRLRTRTGSGRRASRARAGDFSPARWAGSSPDRYQTLAKANSEKVRSDRLMVNHRGPVCPRSVRRIGLVARIQPLQVIVRQCVPNAGECDVLSQAANFGGVLGTNRGQLLSRLRER
jgi:hypothetical protein